MSTYQTKKNDNNNLKGLIIALVLIVAFLAILIPLVTRGKLKEVTEAENGNIIIDASKVSSKATFYSYNYKGTEMEFFAVRDKNGTVRLAFNRCQVCFDSGRGYFKQKGEIFECQNCGNQYQISAIGREKGGCNPSPIMSSDKYVSGDIIEIKRSVFKENQYMF